MKTKLAFASAVAVAALSVLALTVLGHASLESSNPPAGGTTTTPTTLTATFDEELAPDGSSLVIENASGAQVAAGAVLSTETKTMTAQLPQLAAGVYTVRWTAVTADDNAVERGTYQFNVSTANPNSTPGPAGSSDTISGASPAASGSGTPAGPTSGRGSSNDLLVALVLAAVIIAGVVGFFLLRNRR